MVISKPRLLIFIVAYFAERTIEKVIRRIPAALNEHYDVEILVIDDGSTDRTFSTGEALSRRDDVPFKLTILHNPVNQGYGGNQKIGFHYAVKQGFDFVALLHGDGQYAPEMLPTLAEPLRTGDADVVFGSRMMQPKDALRGGMPLYKFVGNRILTVLQNRLLGTQFSEFHSGYRIYSVAALKAVPFDRNANVFHFDTEIIIQMVFAGMRIREVSIPTYYGDEICYVNGLKYAKDVIKATLQARLQSVNLFYDPRFDCAPPDNGSKYPSKLEFDSTHSRVLALIPPGSRVLDLGSGIGAVGAALKQRGCYVVGCDVERGAMVGAFDRFIIADLNEKLPVIEGESFNYVLVLDVVEHLNAPERFLDRLRDLVAQWPDARVIISTANIGFIVMRLSLALGRFEYGKRGILDITHTRLFTMATFRRTLTACGFDIAQAEGVIIPLPFVFGASWLSRWLMAVNKVLVKLRPSVFGFQLLVVAKPRATLDTLLATAEHTAREKSRDLQNDSSTRAA
jgi:glycosyltransferase involved in cell wall biosynthesis